MNRITCLSVIMSTGVKTPLSVLFYSWRTKSSSLKTFSYSEAIISAPASTDCMDFMMNVLFLL